MKRETSISRAEWKDHTLSVPQLEWSDALGRFAGTATWSRANGRAEFQARSSVDLKPLLGSFGLGAMLDGVTFEAPPLIEASGSATIGAAEKQFEVIGKMCGREVFLPGGWVRGLDLRFRLGRQAHHAARYPASASQRPTQRRSLRGARRFPVESRQLDRSDVVRSARARPASILPPGMGLAALA